MNATEKAKARAARMITEAQEQDRLADLVPPAVESIPYMVHNSFAGRPPTIRFSPTRLEDLQRIFRAFDLKESYDLKGTFRGIYPELNESKGEMQFPLYVWAEASKSGTSATATFNAHAYLADGTLVRVSAQFQSAPCFGQPFPQNWYGVAYYQPPNSDNPHERVGHWVKSPPVYFAQGQTTINFASDSGGQWMTHFATLECFEESLRSLPEILEESANA